MLNAILLSARLAASVLPGTLEHAALIASECETPTSWVEQVAPGVWVGVCGDQGGNSDALSCEQTAELHWHMSGGRDSAWEDAYSSCTGITTESDAGYHAIVDAYCASRIAEPGDHVCEQVARGAEAR